MHTFQIGDQKPKSWDVWLVIAVSARPVYCGMVSEEASTELGCDLRPHGQGKGCKAMKKPPGEHLVPETDGPNMYAS